LFPKQTTFLYLANSTTKYIDICVILYIKFTFS